MRLLGLIVYLLALLAIYVDYQTGLAAAQSAWQQSALATMASYRTLSLMALAYALTNFGRPSPP